MLRCLQVGRPILSRHWLHIQRPATSSVILSRSFHTDASSTDQSNKPFWDRGSGSEHANAQFSKYFKDLKHNEAYRNVDPLLVHALSKEAYLSGREDARGTGPPGWVALFSPVLKWIVLLIVLYMIFDQTKKIGLNVFSSMEGDKFDQEYLVETSTKDFSDVKGLPEILGEFEQVVDLIKNKDKYDGMGAKLPRGILLNGPPGTGKTLIAKAIAGEAGVPFLYASGSQFDEMYVGVGAKRMRKLFSEAREQSPCIIFIDEIDAVGGKRGNRGGGSEGSYARMTINQLLQEMDGLMENQNVIVIGATNLKNVIDPALLRPGRFDLTIDVPHPSKEGREEILNYYFSKVKHTKAIDVSKIAAVTTGSSGAQLANIVNQAAIRAVRQGHKEVDLSHLQYAYDKITMGPELLSMKQNADGERKTAIHEGGHCLLAYLLNKEGVYDNKPRKMTVVRRGGALGHVSFISDESSDENSQSLQSLRSHLVVGMGGRAAEAIFAGEEKVCTGASSDMNQALKIAQQIIMSASAGDQVKGRMIDLQTSSEKKKEEVDRLIDTEIDIAYKKAKSMLENESERHNLLIDAMLKFKTLDYEEIDLLLSKKSLEALQNHREENEKKRKQSSEEKGSYIKKMLGSESDEN